MSNFFTKFAKRIKGDIQNDTAKCLYCGRCQKCRAKAITVNPKTKDWKWTDEKCTRCGHCIQECPAKSLSFKK